MLKDTLDDIMSRAQKYEIHTKTTRFSNVFKNLTQGKELENDQMQEKLTEYVTNEIAASQEKDEDSFIVENPDTVEVEIKYNNEPSDLPFFRSIMTKLDRIYVH